MITHISTRHDFSSLYFYRKLHLFMNFSLTKLQRRVSCLWTFFSIRLVKSQKDKYKLQIQTQKSYVSVNISFPLHLIKFQKESWQIQNWLQPVSAHYWLEKTVEPRRKWKWFGHKTIWFGHKKYLSNREIRSPLHWYLIFGEITCLLESVIEKRIFVNIDEYLLIIEYI